MIYPLEFVFDCCGGYLKDDCSRPLCPARIARGFHWYVVGDGGGLKVGPRVLSSGDDGRALWHGKSSSAQVLSTG